MGRERNTWRPGADDEQDGVRIREFGTGPRIEVDFRFKGVRCRECLKFEVTAGNWKYAGRLRAEILNAIERKTFRYGDYFPESSRARIFGHAPKQSLVEDLLRAWFKLCELARERGNMSPSTLTGYSKIIFGILIPEFGPIRTEDLGPGHIKEFILKQDSTAKTIRNVLSPLRQALDDAVDDGHLEANPLHRVNVRKQILKVAKESDFEIDPFDAAERAAFVQACRNEEEQDQYIFWFETGLRPGELIALEWPKFDGIHNKVRIDMSVVEQVEKGPKTDAGVRDVELTPAALAALLRQKARTFLAGGRIWRTPYALAGGRQRQAEQTPWTTDAQLRRISYYPVMKRASIRHRNMYQIRHTFASTLASSGANLFWLAQQMGHETIEMLIRHYARWIPGMSPDGGASPPGAHGNGHVAVTQISGAKVLSMKTRR